MTEKPFLQVEGLVKHYPIGGGLLSKPSGHVRAVDGVTLTIDRPGRHSAWPVSPAAASRPSGACSCG